MNLNLALSLSVALTCLATNVVFAAQSGTDCDIEDSSHVCGTSSASAEDSLPPLQLREDKQCPKGFILADTHHSFELNGDLNQGAGGKDIYLCTNLAGVGVASLHGVKLQPSSDCGSDWERTPTVDLNGDLNESAGGQDIFLCYSTNPSLGRRISIIEMEQRNWYPTSGPELIAPLNGNLNQDAGGKNIYLGLKRDYEGSIPALVFNTSPICPSGYILADTPDGLNGDLNQEAGGRDIYLCASFAWYASPVHAVKLQPSPSCERYWSRPHLTYRGTPGNSWELELNGDLNQGAGGEDIFLCWSGYPLDGKRITNIELVQRRPSSQPRLTAPLNGDLNQGSGGKDIYIKLIRDP